MNRKTSGPFNLYAILGLIFIAMIGLRTISTPEVWTHLAQGRLNETLSYLTYDNAINTTYLYDKLLYGLWNMGHAPALIIFNIICMVAAFVFLIKASEKWGAGISQGFALLLCGWLMFRNVDVGPQTAMMLFIALFIYLLETQRSPAILFGVLIPVQILWTNMHGSFMFGPFIAALALIQNSFEKSGRNKLQKSPAQMMGALVAALLVCTLVNPSFLKLHIQVYANVVKPLPLYWSSMLYDFYPVSAKNPLVFFAMILGAGGLVTLKKKLPIMLTTLAVIGTFLVIRSAQTAAMLFTVLAFPFLVLSFTAVGEALSASFKTLVKPSKVMPLVTRSIFIALLLLSLIPLATNQSYANTGSASSFGFGIEENLFPADLEAIINHEAFPDKTINLAADGGYLAFNYDRQIFIDYRSGRYPKELLEDLNSMLRGDKEAYNRIQETYRPEAIILNTLYASAPQGLANLLYMRVWKLAYFDGTTAILVLNNEKFKPLLDQVETQKAGLAKLEAARANFAGKVGQGIRAPGNPAELIGAAQVFLALNRPTQSKALFALLLKNHAEVPASWIGLGQSQLMLKEYIPATESLKTAVGLSPNNLYAWNSYGVACRLAGLTEEYQQAEQKVKELIEKRRAHELEKEKESKETELPPAVEKTNALAFPFPE